MGTVGCLEVGVIDIDVIERGGEAVARAGVGASQTAQGLRHQPLGRGTAITIKVAIPQLEAELWEKFARFGNLDSVVAKKSFNNEYCYAFIEYKEGEDASEAVK